ncbi:MAG: metallophosphoesterase family protein [Collinsella sp.]
MARRIDIVSDTHGYLAPELKREIDGCDLLIHAGDITSESNWAELEVSVPAIRGVLGNNDGFYAYGPEVRSFERVHVRGPAFRGVALPRAAAFGRRRRGRVRSHAPRHDRAS